MTPVDRLRLALGQEPTLGQLSERLAAAFGRRRLVTDGDTGVTRTYAGAAAEVDRWAGAIRARVAPGDRVVVATANCYEQLLCSLAACRAGAVAVPVNARMRPEEVNHVVADAGASLVVHDPAELEHGVPLGRAEPARPGDIAALFYTSGTTGSPKGVELTNRGLVGSLRRAALVPTMGRDEAVVALPVAHIMGFSGLLGFACAGIPVLFHERFDAVRVLDTIEARRSTVFIGVPAMYRMLLEAGAESRDLSSVRLFLSGADVMPPELAERFRQMGSAVQLPVLGGVGDAVFVEGYGMAELAGAVAGKVSGGLPLLDRVLPGDALGFPLPGYTLRVVADGGARDAGPGEVGELWVRGPGVAAGYWGNAEATAALVTADGWLRTGDLALRGPLGTVRFAGRAKDVVKTGGYSVYAVEVETALQGHPDVAEAAVLGLPDERLGEVPVAAVRLVDGAATGADDLVAWCREHLASYKCPRQVVVVDELPRTGSHKVQKQRLRSLFA